MFIERQKVYFRVRLSHEGRCARGVGPARIEYRHRPASGFSLRELKVNGQAGGKLLSGLYGKLVEQYPSDPAECLEGRVNGRRENSDIGHSNSIGHEKSWGADDPSGKPFGPSL